MEVRLESYALSHLPCISYCYVQDGILGVSHEGPCTHIDYLHHSFVYDTILLDWSFQLPNLCLYTIERFYSGMNLVIILVIRVALTKTLEHRVRASSSSN